MMKALLLMGAACAISAHLEAEGHPEMDAGMPEDATCLLQQGGLRQHQKARQPVPVPEHLAAEGAGGLASGVGAVEQPAKRPTPYLQAYYRAAQLAASGAAP
eukprot:CAMPEP_0176259298 /NCGR_PEP_ID=MMETSP0121_2-20121125/39002_1 /TAXON_ID=160619 /ORGANISM="Kryptoperidinium foliaceum, Strain CCMP 1326" /LENGTH=101 /DNA_ID=CAMNT_0017599187 /DNA_START=105 /DNA_END=407 /DNA_ORIENTATION=-